MIDEEETFRKFGYYSTDLTKYSVKKIVVVCERCGKRMVKRKADYRRETFCKSCVRKGVHPSEETRRKMSESHKGRRPHNYGKPISEEQKQKLRRANIGKKLSEETKRKISEALKGEKAPWFGKHLTEGTRKKISESLKGEKNPLYGKARSAAVKEKISKANRGKKRSEQFKKKMRKSRQRQKIPNRYTIPESIFLDISKSNGVPSQYTGDSSLWIGTEGGKKLNPDFIIEVNGKRYAIEIFGDYWHSPLLNRNLREDATLTYRKKFYKKHGWHPIFIWESDLKREDAEAFVLNLLRKEGVIK